MRTHPATRKRGGSGRASPARRRAPRLVDQAVAAEAIPFAQFVKMAGIHPKLALGLIERRVLDPAIMVEERTEDLYVRPFGLPLLLLADELAALVVAERLTAEQAANTLAQLQQQIRLGTLLEHDERRADVVAANVDRLVAQED